MLKSKILKVALIVILLFSAFNVVQVIEARTDITAIWKTSIGGNKVVITAFIKNEGDIGLYGTPTAEVEGITRTYTSTAERTYFPPHEQVVVTITISGMIPVDYQHLSGLQYVIANVWVSDVSQVEGGEEQPNGNGNINGGEEEPNGNDIVNGGEEEPNDDIIIDGGGKKRDDASVSLPFEWTIIGVGIVAAVAIAAVVVVKKRKVTERDLRALPSNEFQNWVIQRLSGKNASLRDSRMGIDGYTAEGHPIQIKQLDNIGRNEIDTFASVMGRVKAKNGIVVAFSFSDDVYRGIVRARVNYRIEIKKVTVKELIDHRKII